MPKKLLCWAAVGVHLVFSHEMPLNAFRMPRAGPSISSWSLLEAVLPFSGLNLGPFWRARVLLEGLRRSQEAFFGSPTQCQRPSRPIIKTLCAFLPGVFSAAEMEEGDGGVGNEGLECRKTLSEEPYIFVSWSTVFRAYCSEELLVKSSLHIAVSSRAPDVLCRRCVCELGATNKRIE